MSKILGIIPSRIGSVRLPRKPLADLKGKSLIQRAYESCLNSKLVSDFIVATDSQEIYDHVLSFGGNVEMTSQEHVSGTARVIEVANRHPEYNYVMNLQGDQPILTEEHIDNIARKMFMNDDEKQSRVFTPIFKFKEDVKNINHVKVVINKNKEALYFSRSVIPYSRENMEIDYWKHLGIYGYNKKAIEKISKFSSTYLERTEMLEQLTWLYYDIKISCVEVSSDIVSVDSPEDLEKVINLL